MSQNTKFNAAILIIGNEILSGRTQDTNTSTIAQWLNSIGVKVNEVRVIQDIENTIIETVNHLRKVNNYVFTTGGIGPTHDDITAQSISKAFNLEYEIHKEAFKILEAYYKVGEFNEGRKKMAKMPKNSSLILNPSSGAPGFKIKNIFCLPGVPIILKSMLPNISKYLDKGSVVISKSISLHTVESNIALQLGRIQKKFNNKVDIGSYPFFRLGKVGVSIVLRTSSKSILNKCLLDVKKMVKKKKIKLFKR